MPPAAKPTFLRPLLEDLAWACRLATPLLWALAAGVAAGSAIRSAAVSGLVAAAWLVVLLFWREWRWRWF